MVHYEISKPKRLLGVQERRNSVASAYVIGGILVLGALTGAAGGAIAACNVQLHIANTCLGNFKSATGRGSDLLKSTEERIGADVKMGACSSTDRAEIGRASSNAGERAMQLSQDGQLKSTSEVQEFCLNHARKFSN